MSNLVLSDTLIRRLEKVAQEKNLTPAELLEHMLDRESEPSRDEYEGYATLADLAQNTREAHETLSETTPEEPPPGSLAALAQAAIRANIRSGHPVDTSSRVNEIMRTEFADYVRRWMIYIGFVKFYSPINPPS